MTRFHFAFNTNDTLGCERARGIFSIDGGKGKRHPMSMRAVTGTHDRGMQVCRRYERVLSRRCLLPNENRPWLRITESNVNPGIARRPGVGPRRGFALNA